MNFNSFSHDCKIEHSNLIKHPLVCLIISQLTLNQASKVIWKKKLYKNDVKKETKNDSSSFCS